MKISLMVVALIVAATALPASASSFDCVQPELPARSTTKEGVRRVQKLIQTWRTCYAQATQAGAVTTDAQRLNADVDAAIASWIDNTRAFAASDANSRRALAQIERDRAAYLRDQLHVETRGR